MKLFFGALIFSALVFGSFSVTVAQNTTSTAAGTVINKKQTDSQTKKKSGDISKFDFKNYTYQLPNIKNLENTVTLRNGTSVKKDGSGNFKLRKTYYFDLTGDNEDEAITLISVDGCQMGCESSQLFYIFTTENYQPKLIWKIAVGGDVLGGLKAAHFEVKEFVIETFGDCTIEDWYITTNLDLKKNPKAATTSYSHFVFKYENGSFANTSKIVLPFTANLNMVSYRPKISFGEQE